MGDSLQCKTCKQPIEACNGCGSTTGSCGDPICKACMKKRE